MIFEPIRPESAVTVEPLVDQGEWRRVEAVDAPLGFAAVRYEARVAQDAQVARDGRLTDGERSAKFASAAFSLAKHLDDLTPRRIRECLERVHNA